MERLHSIAKFVNKTKFPPLDNVDKLSYFMKILPVRKFTLVGRPLSSTVLFGPLSLTEVYCTIITQTDEISISTISLIRKYDLTERQDF